MGISGPMSFLRESLVPGPFQEMGVSRGWVLTPEGGYVKGVVIPPDTWDLGYYWIRSARILLECFLVFHSFILCNYGLLTQSLFLPRRLLFGTA